jgi:hypothetical protein
MDPRGRGSKSTEGDSGAMVVWGSCVEGMRLRPEVLMLV